MEVEQIEHEDNGGVAAETIITLDETEVVVVEFRHDSSHSVYERDIGDEEPHTKLV